MWNIVLQCDTYDVSCGWGYEEYAVWCGVTHVCAYVLLCDMMVRIGFAVCAWNFEGLALCFYDLHMILYDLV